MIHEWKSIITFEKTELFYGKIYTLHMRLYDT